MSRHNILCHDRVGQGQELYVATEYFCVATKFILGQGILCHNRVWPGHEFFCRDRRFLGRDRMVYVAT